MWRREPTRRVRTNVHVIGEYETSWFEYGITWRSELSLPSRLYTSSSVNIKTLITQRLAIKRTLSVSLGVSGSTPSVRQEAFVSVSVSRWPRRHGAVKSISQMTILFLNLPKLLRTTLLHSLSESSSCQQTIILPRMKISSRADAVEVLFKNWFD